MMSSKKETVYLSIGSNKGSKQENLRQAVRYLEAHQDIMVDAVSSFYRTQPQNYTDQDWFVNAAVRIRTALEPQELLKTLKQIEKKMDKDGKPFRFGPRIIDLDIILYADRIQTDGDLEIPHPRMHERCFVLIPLCDIGADAVHPVLKKTPAQLLEKIEEKQTQEVVLLEGEAEN